MSLGLNGQLFALNYEMNSHTNLKLYLDDYLLDSLQYAKRVFLFKVVAKINIYFHKIVC